MVWILGILLGLIGAILLCVILNSSKAARKLGLMLALFAACFMIFHGDGAIIPASNNYDLDDTPFLLGLVEGFLEVFLFTFPIIRAIVGLANLADAYEKEKTVLCHNCSKKVIVPKGMTPRKDPICPFCKKSVYSTGKVLGDQFISILPRIIHTFIR
mgnify:CR=1 FL=1